MPEESPQTTATPLGLADPWDEQPIQNHSVGQTRDVWDFGSTPVHHRALAWRIGGWEEANQGVDGAHSWPHLSD